MRKSFYLFIYLFIYLFTYLFIFESKHIQNLISKKSTRACKYYATSPFIDDLCAINDDDESSKSFKCIYLDELELKLEHSEIHATFLDLDIKIEIGVFVYGSVFSEFLGIARCTLTLEYFLSRTSELYSRVLS